MTFVGNLEPRMGKNEFTQKEGEKVSKKLGIGCISWKLKDTHEKETKATEPFTGKRKSLKGRHCVEMVF